MNGKGEPVAGLHAPHATGEREQVHFAAVASVRTATLTHRAVRPFCRQFPVLVVPMAQLDARPVFVRLARQTLPYVIIRALCGRA